MNECPQGTCDGVEIIKSEMVTKTTIRWAIGIISSLVIAFGIYGLTANAKAKDERRQNKENIAVLSKAYEIDISNINKNIDELAKSQHRIWRKINKD